MTGFAGRWRRRRPERGAVLIEFTIIAPLLLLLVCGLADYGFAWRDGSNVLAAARAGARVGASSGKARSADFDILQSVKSASANVADVRYVVVYRSTAVDGAVPAQCLTFVSQAGLCNVYTGTQLQTLTAANFPSANTTCAGNADAAWCPTTRSDDQVAGLDKVGVLIQAHRDWMTGVLPGTGITMNERAVMQIEPGG